MLKINSKSKFIKTSNVFTVQTAFGRRRMISNLLKQYFLWEQDWVVLQCAKNTDFVFKLALVLIKTNRSKTNDSEIIQPVTA